VVPEKRKLKVVGASIAAAFVLTGCAPAALDNASDYGAEPAANAVDATATPTPGAEPADAAGEGDDADATELSDDEVTGELHAVKVKRMGETVQNEDGFVLYRFDDDKVKPEVVSNCNGDCAKVWPPAVINSGENSSSASRLAIKPNPQMIATRTAIKTSAGFISWLCYWSLRSWLLFSALFAGFRFAQEIGAVQGGVIVD